MIRLALLLALPALPVRAQFPNLPTAAEIMNAAKEGVGAREAALEGQDVTDRVIRRLAGMLQKDERGRFRSYTVRVEAAKSLAEYKSAAKIVLGELKEIFKITPEGYVREHIIYVLGSMGPEAEKTDPEIVSVLASVLEKKDEDEYSGARKAAAIALGEIGSKSKEALRALSAAAKRESGGDERYLVRSAVITALAKIKAQDEEVLAALIDVMRKRRSRLEEANTVHLRERSAWALGQIGARTPEVIDALSDTMVEDENENVRGAAKRALKELASAPGKSS